jgi:hypothetical protein
MAAAWAEGVAGVHKAVDEVARVVAAVRVAWVARAVALREAAAAAAAAAAAG